MTLLKIIIEVYREFFSEIVIHRQVTKLVNHETFLAQNLNADDLIKFTNDKIC